MKTRINNVKKGVVTLLFAAVIAGLTACETDPVKSQRGELPDKDLLENTYVKIRSIKSPTEFAVVNLSEGTTVTRRSNLLPADPPGRESDDYHGCRGRIAGRSL